MKKIVVCILAFLYLGITTGLAVNIQYCMGKISEIKFDNIRDNGCKCKSKTTMPCCGHEYLLIKVSDAHQLVDNEVNFHTPEIQVHSFNNFMLAACNQYVANASTSAYAPPLSPPDICIKNCVFRI